jgi:hypothetical protein
VCEGVGRGEEGARGSGGLDRGWGGAERDSHRKGGERERERGIGDGECVCGREAESVCLSVVARVT